MLKQGSQKLEFWTITIFNMYILTVKSFLPETGCKITTILTTLVFTLRHFDDVFQVSAYYTVIFNSVKQFFVAVLQIHY